MIRKHDTDKRINAHRTRLELKEIEKIIGASWDRRSGLIHDALVEVFMHLDLPRRDERLENILLNLIKVSRKDALDRIDWYK